MITKLLNYQQELEDSFRLDCSPEDVDIFKEAYLLSACNFICIHNHPSGDSAPSSEDVNITKNLKQLGLLHGINLIDHIIIGDHTYSSFKELGLI